MNIGNCPECGRLYQKTALGMCADCYRKEEEYEALVSEYVRDNPKSSVQSIHEATGVKEKTIHRMIKEGRFFDETTRIAYPCQQCGASIYEGRICQKCNERFLKQVRAAEAKRRTEKKEEQAESAKERGRGMYTKNM